MHKNIFSTFHTKQTLNLAWPLVLTQVGHVVTAMVDTIFLGKIGATEQAAGILSSNLYILILVFAIGMSYATTPLTTAAFEKQDSLKKAELFKNSLFLNFVVASICFVLLFFASNLLQYMQQPKEVVDLAKPFFNVLIFSMIPMSLFFTSKQYCEGLSNTKMALLISVIGNLLNIILNYGLIYGKCGLPEMGYMGSAWASFFARMFMGVSFLVFVFYSPITKEIRYVFKLVKINKQQLFQLWQIGFNSAMQFTFEVAAFVIAGLMAGSFGKEQIDAHGIAMNIAAFTYMFGSGIGSAATIRVGIYKAQNNWNEIKVASQTAMRLVVLIMGTFGVLLLILKNILPHAFSNEISIVQRASTLLIIAALFQLFDGLQVTIIGILRGLEDTKAPTYITLVGYWFIALPLAYLLAFNFHLQTVGIWIALLVSLLLVSIGLYWRWYFLVKQKLNS